MSVSIQKTSEYAATMGAGNIRDSKRARKRRLLLRLVRYTPPSCPAVLLCQEQNFNETYSDLLKAEGKYLESASSFSDALLATCEDSTGAAARRFLQAGFFWTGFPPQDTKAYVWDSFHGMQ
eukprot:6491957-Amphidinium_carterae.3